MDFTIEDKDIKNQKEKFLNELKDSFFDYLSYNCEINDLDHFYSLCVRDKLNPNVFCSRYQKTPQWVKEAQSLIKEHESTFFENLKQKTVNYILVNVKFSKENAKRIIDMNKYLQQFFSNVQIQIQQKELKYKEIKNVALIAQENADITVDGYPLLQVIEAEIASTSIANKLKKLGMSNFEKFLIAHDYVTSMLYNDTPATDNIDKLELVDDDTTVITEYAKIMQNFCEKLGIKCEYINSPNKEVVSNDEADEFYFDPNIQKQSGYSFNVINLKDPKYNINGIYICDPCRDAKYTRAGTNCYLHSAEPTQDVLHNSLADCFTINEKYLTPVVSNLTYPIPQYPLNSQPIPIETFKKGLTNAYMAFQFDDKTMTPQRIMDGLNNSTKFASLKMDIENSENCFATRWKEILAERERLKKQLNELFPHLY